MGSNTVFRRRPAIRCGNDHIDDIIQAVGTDQCRNHILHLMAVSALGHQADVEPLHRRGEDQTMVGGVHAVAHRGCVRWCGIHHTHRFLAAGHTILFLADGLQQCHTRHCSRRFLYDWAQRARPGLVCGHQKHLLPCRYISAEVSNIHGA